MTCLITGGAGFIGTRLAKRLIEQNHLVRILDNLTPQVHSYSKPEEYVPLDGCEFIFGDVRDTETVSKALQGVDLIFHLAAQTGVGQSMYQIREYFDCNVTGTASLWEAIIAQKDPIRRIVLASSRAVYGEGSSICREHGLVAPEARETRFLNVAQWDPKCPRCGQTVEAAPTSENRDLKPISIYGLTKKAQEDLCFSSGRAHGVPVVALRFFNVLGGGQSLMNPYTGILTAFFSGIKSGKTPEVYEDGLESRDFVHIDDVVQACLKAATAENIEFQSLNIGSGKPVSILDVARLIMAMMGMTGGPRISGRWRVGDIRHCFADLTMARRLLAYEPVVDFETGVNEFLSWANNERFLDKLETACAEMQAKGLMGKGRR